MKKTQGVTQANVLTEQHNEISVLLKKLFYQLDASSNNNFTPKPPKAELVIKPNVSAITMEEITPIGVSSSDILAPGEIYKKPTSEIKGETELTSEEKKRKRREFKEQNKAAKKRKESEQKTIEKQHPEMKKQDTKKEAIDKIKNKKRGNYGKASRSKIQRYKIFCYLY